MLTLTQLKKKKLYPTTDKKEARNKQRTGTECRRGKMVPQIRRTDPKDG